MTNFRALAFSLAVCLASSVAADDWASPRTARVCAADGSYCLNVVPNPIESLSDYFEDGGKNPGADPSRAKATLERRTEKGLYQRVAAFPLLNRVAPVSVLVLSKGDVVTFDNWHRLGYGDDVVVLYRSDGKVVKQYSLEQLLSKEKVQTLPHSVSSIWWGGEHFLDEKAGHIVLLVAREGSEISDQNYERIRLDLATGKKVE